MARKKNRGDGERGGFVKNKPPKIKRFPLKRGGMKGGQKK